MTIPITLLTGFLGAGKTTLLNALLREPAFSNTAVLINEFGDLAIDSDLVERFDDNIVETSTGCLCCSISSDVRRSLSDIMNLSGDRKALRFDRVIVETTGLADPAPVINALIQPPWGGVADLRVWDQFSLARVVAVFDVVSGPQMLDQHLEALKQLALADVVVLTKADLAHDPATQRDILVKRLSSMNPGAEIVDKHADWSRLVELICSTHNYDLRNRSEDALGWLQADAVLAANAHVHEHADANRHGDITAHCITLDAAIPPPQFDLFLETLRLYAGSKLIRVKGLFKLADAPDRPMVVHGVQHIISPVARLEKWPSADDSTRVVLIGRDINTEIIKTILKGSWARPPSVSPPAAASCENTAKPGSRPGNIPS